jgi:lipid-binding SYLF domain-containing protein
VEGIVKEEKAEKVDDGEKKKKTVKVLRKIPPKVMKEARGIVIFTAMRSGIAPFGGAGGTGLVLARLPDGCKSSSMSRVPPLGLMLTISVVSSSINITKQSLNRSTSRYGRLRLYPRLKRSKSGRRVLYS